MLKMRRPFETSDLWYQEKKSGSKLTKSYFDFLAGEIKFPRSPRKKITKDSAHGVKGVFKILDDVDSYESNVLERVGGSPQKS